MAMSPDILATAIAGRFGHPPTDYLKIVCEEIIKHIETFGQVAPLTIIGTSPPGGGPVTGVTLLSPPGVIK